jgi:hypothetical protein
MKAYRLSLVSLVAVAVASASFAGPAPRYSKSRSAVPPPAAEKPVAVKAEKEACKVMPVTHGRFTRMVKCDPDKVPGCKAHCEK